MTAVPFDAAAFLKAVTGKPGVYRMFDADGQLLYVGKANNLKKRLSSYFRKTGLSPKTAALVARIQHIDTTITANETEALLLEQSLIKVSRPPYNILLRDDKSYPHVYLSSGDAYPRLGLHRGAKKAKGRYFGPYPSAGAIRESLSLLQKTFKVRQCEDSYFRNRLRPCLQYQIKRCKAPCVGFVSEEEYAEDVRHSVMFLEGRSNALSDELTRAMETAAQELQFERAAELRDQIAQLRRVQDQQSIDTEHGNVDIVAAAVMPGGACVHVIMVRQGRVLGSRNHFPRVPIEQSPGEVLAAFLPQYYLGGAERELPGEIIVNAVHEDLPVIADALAQARGFSVTFSHKVRGTRSRWQSMAVTNAEQALASMLSNRQNIQARFEALQEALQLDELPMRLECYDISHTSGESTVASCVVFGPEGPLKSDYRRYNIEGITAGDDYAAMHQVLMRRFTRLREGEGKMPDILLVDGGKGQMKMAREVLPVVRDTPVLAGAGYPRSDPAWCGQGRDTQGRPGNSVPERSAQRAGAARPLSGAASDPAYPRRSAPFCHHRPPSAPRQDPQHLNPGRHPRGWAEAAAGAAQTLRWPAGTDPRQHRRNSQSARYQQKTGGTDIYCPA